MLTHNIGHKYQESSHALHKVFVTVIQQVWYFTERIPTVHANIHKAGKCQYIMLKRCMKRFYLSFAFSINWPLGDFNEIFHRIPVVDRSIHCDIALRWMSLYLTNDKPTLVQVMAWCLMAPSHYLTKPLSEPKLTKIYVTIWYHQATMNW